ncbi:MAG: tRNA (N6-threonylcarbamoyladenosine(37)-N6)-methyltransferase TrmO [Prevotella sp.]|nr:tRNA (N6-threonylcarbamoyladenosine(37)-N6)-methyltransferase TrmO [Bacteroidales bacterium]MDY4228796.1 tRNA (N6-threonylcarbamoyladenosine(37)-N6)-methyltransferase TrmO [Prevotella sp.]
MEIKPIAIFHSPFSSKFGIPKQSGIVDTLQGRIVMEPQWRMPEALKGLEGFDYLWLVWGFSANSHAPASPMVRPPRLGGNERVGVFASRSPFRPNPIGLSSVRLEGVEWEGGQGPVIVVRGADLMDGTPIYDIKPYVAYADSHPDARSGFVDTHQWRTLRVEIMPAVETLLSQKGFPHLLLAQLRDVLTQDPRPQYQKDPDRVYGMPFAGFDIRFRVCGDQLTVIDAEKM